MMTIKRAKEICKSKYGRLPRPGYEMLVETGARDRFEYKVWLINEAGRFRVREWESVTLAPAYRR